MSTVPFLPKDRKSLYVRVFIPRSLQHFFNSRSELWRTLDTLDKFDASWKAASIEGRVRRLFYLLTLNGERMTPEQIDTLVESWLGRELDHAEDARAGSGPYSERYREDVGLILSDLQEDAYEALQANNYKTVATEADELLKAAGLPALDHDGAEFPCQTLHYFLSVQKSGTSSVLVSV